MRYLPGHCSFDINVQCSGAQIPFRLTFCGYLSKNSSRVNIYTGEYV